jgi:hypothetical protein
LVSFSAVIIILFVVTRKLDVCPVVQLCSDWEGLRYVSILTVIPGYQLALNAEVKWLNEMVGMGHFGAVKISEEMRR